MKTVEKYIYEMTEDQLRNVLFNIYEQCTEAEIMEYHPYDSFFNLEEGFYCPQTGDNLSQYFENRFED